MNEEKTTIELEIESDLFNWFDEYCKDGLLEMEDELVAVVEQYMQEQIDEAVGDGKSFDDSKDESEVFEDYEEEDLNPDG